MSWSDKAFKLVELKRLDRYEVMKAAKAAMGDDIEGSKVFEFAGHRFHVCWCAIVCPSIDLVLS